ncbi:MAG: hypothetical protein FWD31_13275 [Planctomycetaceae bacterium]|nr:hypothetical protein [Planctomycetaceae bacterium]
MEKIKKIRSVSPFPLITHHLKAEKCYPDDEPMEAKEASPLDRFTHGFSQWVSRSWQRGLEKIAKAIQAVKKNK